MPNLQEIGDALETHLSGFNNYFSLSLGEKELCGVKRTDGYVNIACGRGNSFRSCMLRKVNGKWRLFSRPLMPSRSFSRVLDAVYRHTKLVGE